MVKINVYIFTKIIKDKENVDKIVRRRNPSPHDREDVDDMDEITQWGLNKRIIDERLEEVKRKRWVLSGNTGTVKKREEDDVKNLHPSSNYREDAEDMEEMSQCYNGSTLVCKLKGCSSIPVCGELHN